jgi:spermidine/putrescine transport system substrate-binding protein
MRFSKLFVAGATASLIVIAGLVYLSLYSPIAGHKTFRLLAYAGYDEPEFLSPIEHAIDVKVVVDTYVSGEEMYTKFVQSPPHTYDVVVLDAEYGKKLFEQHRIAPLEPSLWKYQDSFRKFQNGDPARSGEAVYAVPARWGALGLVFNSRKIDPARVKTYKVLYDEDLKGHIGIFDWYLPNMGVLSLALGNAEPYNIDSDHLAAVQDALQRLRPQISSIQPSPGQVLASLRSGSIYVAPGIGEWAAAALASEGLPIDWIVPNEGGVMWVEAFSVAADSDHLELARAFVAEAMKPSNLALLATRKAYFSQVSRTSAYAFIPDQAKNVLKANDLDGLKALADGLKFRYLPGPKTSEQDWLSVWTKFKTYEPPN